MQRGFAVANHKSLSTVLLPPAHFLFRNSHFLIARSTPFTAPPRLVKLERMKQFTLEYWTDDGWFVGRLKEMPAVMSQGETLEELQTMIRDAYRLMVEDAAESAAVPSERHEMLISL